MPRPKQLLIIGHCPSPNTQAMVDALCRGANTIVAESTEEDGLSYAFRSPFECDANDVLEADALIIFTTENFGYMSGALKDFFERIYYPCLDDKERNEAKPYAMVIKAGLDGTGATNSVKKITGGLRWKEVNPVLLCKGEFCQQFLDQCNEAGQVMAASLDANII